MYLKFCFLSVAKAMPSAKDICQNKDLSLRLYDVLEYIDATNERKDTMADIATIIEISSTFCFPHDVSVYQFGSRYEGSTTPNMVSDFDVVLIFTKVNVATHIAECHNFGYLLVPDIQPGYAKVQFVVCGQELYQPLPKPDNAHSSQFRLVSDKFNRVCLGFHNFISLEQSLSMPGIYVNGPAIRLNLPGREHDCVYALKGKSWPECAREWLSRRREYGWPSSELIDKCKYMGFLLVPIGHPLSEEKDKQYRLSFSIQERTLVT